MACRARIGDQASCRHCAPRASRHARAGLRPRDDGGLPRGEAPVPVDGLPQVGEAAMHLGGRGAGGRAGRHDVFAHQQHHVAAQAGGLDDAVVAGVADLAGGAALRRRPAHREAVLRVVDREVIGQQRGERAEIAAACRAVDRVDGRECGGDACVLGRRGDVRRGGCQSAWAGSAASRALKPAIASRSETVMSSSWSVVLRRFWRLPTTRSPTSSASSTRRARPCRRRCSGTPARRRPRSASAG